jgi:ATP-dependent RNA helicase MSS116
VQQPYLQVKQSAAVVPMKDHMSMLKQLIDEHCAKEPNHKIMCFFTTARSTALAAELFGHMRSDIVEIHSRKSQSARTKVGLVPVEVRWTHSLKAPGFINR